MGNSIKIEVSEETFKQLVEMTKKARKKMTKEDFVRVAVENYYTAFKIGESVKKNAESIVRSIWTEEELEKMEKEFNERKGNHVEKSEK